MKKKSLLFLGLIFIFISLKVSSAIIYVNQSAAGTNDGSSWLNAYTNLSSALNASISGDEIWVAKGIYKPDIPFDFNSNGVNEIQEVTFQVKEGIQLYGGFIGTEALRNQRDWNSNLTILSGDIDNNDLDPNGDGVVASVDDILGKNAFHVVYANTEMSGTVIDGLIINAGYASKGIDPSDPNYNGGGLFYRPVSPDMNNYTPKIENTVFIANYSKDRGGAIYNESPIADGSITSNIRYCKFINNVSKYEGGAIFAGNKSPHSRFMININNCQFIGNEAELRGGALYFLSDFALIDSSAFISNKTMITGSTSVGSGGAIYLEISNGTIKNTVFSWNVATGSSCVDFVGGGGGAVYMNINVDDNAIKWPCEPKFINCIFHKNIAGGNGNAWGGAILNDCKGGHLNPEFTNCMFYRNGAHDYGAAVANVVSSETFAIWYLPLFSPLFTNCTFYGNHAGKKGGAIYNQGYDFFGTEMLTAKIENTILWKNTSVIDGDEIFSTANIDIQYSLIKGSGGSGPGWNTAMGTDGGNNLDIDPLFEDISLPYGTLGKKLSISSLAINAGNNSAAGIAGIISDLIGNPRIQNSIIDLGAIETPWTTSLKNQYIEEFSLFPVPAKNTLTVKSNSSLKGKYLVKIRNIKGLIENEIVLYNLNKECPINIQSLSKGIYNFEIIDPAGKHISKSFVKE